MLCSVLLQVRRSYVTGEHSEPVERLGTTWNVCESVALGGYKMLRVDCDIILWLFLNTQTLSSPSLWEKELWAAVPFLGQCHGDWCLPHWAKAWASLAESVSPFGSALAQLFRVCLLSKGYVGHSRKICISCTPSCCGRVWPGPQAIF